MGSPLLKLYHRLPAPLRSAAATLRGVYLDRCRHGTDSAQLAEEVRERDRWTATQWKTWREERLGYILHRAATRVPYYRQSQIVQEELDLLLVRIAPAPGFTAGHEQTIIHRLRERMGDVRVTVERVEEVPRSANGKLRAVISNLSATQRAAALERTLVGAGGTPGGV